MARPSARINTFVIKAKNYLRVKNFAGAHSILRDGMAAFPENSKLLHLAGRTAYLLGNYREATELLLTSLAHAHEAEAYCDLGLVYLALKNMDDSTICLRTAIQLNPKLYPAHVNLGFTLLNLGDLSGALNAFYAAFKLEPQNIDPILGLNGILEQAAPEKHTPLIDQMLVSALENTGADWQSFAPAAANQLIKKYAVESDGSSTHDMDPRDPLLRLYLTNCINISPELEFHLTHLRRKLLFTEPENFGGIASDMAALIALQVFNNEYVFFIDPEENIVVSAIRDKIESALLSGDFSEKLELEVLVLSMYQPLSAIAGAMEHLNTFEANGAVGFCDIVHVTLRNHMEELALKSTIGSFSQIENQTSQKVRGQYEEHPYPRWVQIPHVAPVNLSFLLKTNFPHFSPPQFLEDPKTILIAGCGTGRHAALVALQWPRADVLAIDLSTASIAYAMRKTKELRIKNIRFLHGDILEAEKLGNSFDMIQSIGVLHHMKEPLGGLRILSGLIRDGGVFKGGLYCERGRQGVFAARRTIAKEAIDSDHGGITSLRQRILKGEFPGDCSNLVEFFDFFSISSCRDLMFHVHEDNYTPLRLKAEIEDVGLVFLGFNELEELGINAEYRKRFPDDPSLTNLENWEDFENAQKHPLEGYDFWCYKPV